MLEDSIRRPANVLAGNAHVFHRRKQRHGQIRRLAALKPQAAVVRQHHGVREDQPFSPGEGHAPKM